MTISIELSDDTEHRLKETAQRLNLSVEDLATAVIRDLVSVPAADFDTAASRVLQKNAELYRRLV